MQKDIPRFKSGARKDVRGVFLRAEQGATRHFSHHGFIDDRSSCHVSSFTPLGDCILELTEVARPGMFKEMPHRSRCEAHDRVGLRTLPMNLRESKGERSDYIKRTPLQGCQLELYTL